jgi:hypothetical protein
VTPSPQLNLVHQAIRSGIFGQIRWKDAAAKLARADPKLSALPPARIRELLRQFVLAGGTRTVRQETRAEFLADDPDDPYWYRGLIPLPGQPDVLFLEVKLFDADPNEPWVEIVSAHLQAP